MLQAQRRCPFAETGFLYALVDQDDRHHDACRTVLADAVEQRRRLITSNFVVAETHALVLARLGRRLAVSWLQSIGSFAQVERITEGDEERAVEIILRYDDKDFSYTDATSFAAMERLRLSTALSVDGHFVQYGKFVVLPLMGSAFPE